jgi:hypothetical protein
MKKFLLLILGLSLLLEPAIYGADKTSLLQKMSDENQYLFDPLIRQQNHRSKHRDLKKSEITCLKCRKGRTGPSGPVGPAGVTGPTGPAGPLAIPNFISLFVLQGDFETVELNDPISFTNTSAQNGSITLSPDGKTVTISESGIYKVSFGVACVGGEVGIKSNGTDNTFSLQLNGSSITGAAYNTGDTDGLSGLTIDINISPSNLPAKLQVVYTFTDEDETEVTLSVNQVDDLTVTAAYLEIHQIM